MLLTAAGRIGQSDGFRFAGTTILFFELCPELLLLRLKVDNFLDFLGTWRLDLEVERNLQDVALVR